MSKGYIDIYICIDGVLVHDKKDNSIEIWYENQHFIKILKSKRKIEEVLKSL